MEKWYKKKILKVIPVWLVLLLGLALVSAVVILIATIPTSVTVTEALSTTKTSITISDATMGPTSYDIPIKNDANVNVNAEILWTELTNPTGVVYTVNLPKNIVLSPGDNTVTVTFTIAGDSPVGTFTGNVIINRIA